VLSLLARLRYDQRGFTIIETLVACVTGVIVTGALFTILDFTVKQNSRLSGYAQASQVSRLAMTRIVEELHSACLASGFSPVISTTGNLSGPSRLVLVNGYNEKTEAEAKKEKETGVVSYPEAELRAESIHKDVIEYKSGKLTDTVYKAESNTPIASGETGYAERYKWAATPFQTRQLAENVSQVEEGSEKIPVFRYYAYSKTSHSEAGKAASALEEKSLTPTESSTLTESGAEEVASIVVAFRTGPYSKEKRLTSASEKGQFADLTSQTTFAFSVPNAEAELKAGPCE
jgi:Prokaryotic N-terminal methylation motif